MAMYMYYRTMCILYILYFLQSTEYTECHAFCPFVGIGSPHPFTRKRVLLSPLWVQGGRLTRLRWRGWGNPIPTKGQTLWYSMYEYTVLYYTPSTLQRQRVSNCFICGSVVTKRNMLYCTIESYQTVSPCYKPYRE